MWTHPATQRNVGTLREFGYIVIEPEVDHIHWADFSAIVECVARGAEAASVKIGEIRRLMKSARWSALLGYSRSRRLARAYLDPVEEKKGPVS